MGRFAGPVDLKEAQTDEGQMEFAGEGAEPEGANSFGGAIGFHAAGGMVFGEQSAGRDGVIFHPTAAMDDGSRWFAAEQGTNVEVNSAISYYRLGPDGWKKAGSVMLPAGIQQNMATITNGRMIYSYGCTQNSVIETWFDTAKPRWNRGNSSVSMCKVNVLLLLPILSSLLYIFQR